MSLSILAQPTNQTSGAVTSNTSWSADDAYEVLDKAALVKRIAGTLMAPALALSQTQAFAQPSKSAGDVWQITVQHREVEKTSLSPASIRVLGDHGVQRFGKFLRYPNGWDSGRGKALDSRSLNTLNSFLSVITRFPSSVSLFMTTEGFLQIAWDGADGAVELDCLPEELIAYMEEHDQEFVLPANGAGFRAMAVRLRLT